MSMVAWRKLTIQNRLSIRDGWHYGSFKVIHAEVSNRCFLRVRLAFGSLECLKAAEEIDRLLIQ